MNAGNLRKIDSRK